MNRRSILSLIAGAPLAGKAVAEQAVQSMGNPSWGAEASSGMMAPGQATINKPQMDHASAMRFIFNDADALAEARAEFAAAELRSNPYIDPDIQIMKSFSPMAKIAFQRQRNIERAMADAFDHSYDRPNRYVRAIETRLKKLMWGN